MSTIDDQEIGLIASRQILDLFVMPEVERRQQTGELPRPLALEAAQVIFYPDGRLPEIRVNSEVRYVVGLVLKPGVDKNPGDRIHAEEIEGISKCNLPDGECGDCGHATLFNVDGRWTLAFDFIMNKKTAAVHLDVAEEFIRAAAFSLSRGDMSAFLDSLYSSVELAIKSLLLTKVHEVSLRKKTSHKAILSRSNLHTRYGLVKQSYVHLLKQLTELRRKARYLDSPFSLSCDDGHEMIGVANSLILEGRRLAGSNNLRS